MENAEFLERPHRRFNRLTGEWVLVSPHRAKRPWSGLNEEPEKGKASQYDPDCYLCPGNVRAEGADNPQYTSTFVFTNDFAALLPEDGTGSASDSDDLLRAEPESGICRVICYSPRHDLTVARMSQEMVLAIVDTWQREYAELGARSDINHVQIFENRGLIMGCSNPHPHGQIWANQTIPTLPAAEDCQQRNYLREKGKCLLCSYLERELTEGERILFANDSFVALVPYWAVWPFETMILPRHHRSSINNLTLTEKNDLAEMMIRLGICYDNLFLSSFPYSMGLHQQPTDGGDHPHWHWHMHYLPPLLRSQTVRKHMVGYELLAMPQRDITPESAAERLRGLSVRHYTEKIA
ncbi:UDP-glucose--hexose-1-phosphate uridylyltransferase [Desulfosediminicola sp.]|uniref:UDP-glucose--hexose-1-phosphate uridylyltransferase n=1 Tax=Desulfosediminicola sp. TaxID=2886825 RepID=UPI003AF2DE75